MSKIFSTQLSGLFNKVAEDEFLIEDVARLLAQAAVGDGHIYIHGTDEMMGILPQAMDGIDRMPSCKPLSGHWDEISPMDRILLFSRNSDDPEALEIARRLKDGDIPFASVSMIKNADSDGVQHLADLHIALPLKRGLVPTDTGDRTGFPTLLLALYTYHLILLTLTELLEEVD